MFYDKLLMFQSVLDNNNTTRVTKVTKFEACFFCCFQEIEKTEHFISKANKTVSK